MITLDKELYRYAHQLHQQWNEAELKARIQNAASRPPQEAWQQYMALWEFCMRLAPQPSRRQRVKRLMEWNRYYARIQKLEEWRQHNGTTTRC